MRLRHLFKIAITIGCLLVPSSVVPQSASEIGLVLRAESPRSIRPCDGRTDNQDCLKYRMVFENLGKRPVIIINPALSFGTGIKEVRVFYQEYGREPGSYIQVEGAKKSAAVDITKRESFRSIGSLFDADRPPQNLTIILNPGESYTFDESFLVISDKRIPEKEFDAVRWKHPIGDECNQRGCLRIPYGRKLVYEFSFTQFFEDPEFIRKLARRWSAFGYFPIDEDGTYSITSEMTPR